LLPQSLALSLVSHLLLTGVFFPSVQNLWPNILSLTVADVILWAILLAPVLGAARRRLYWFDPLVFYFGFLFLSVFTAFGMLLYDSAYVFGYMSFGGQNFSGVSDVEKVTYIFRAEVLLIIFSFAVLLVNRGSQSGLVPIKPSLSERRAALLAFAFLAVLGISAFLFQYSLAGYEAALLQPGTSDIAAGEARLVLAQLLPVYMLSLAAALSFADISGGARSLNLRQSLALLAATLVACLPVILTGARLDVLFLIAVPVFVFPHFRLNVPVRHLLVLAGFAVLLLAGLTLIRYAPPQGATTGQLLQVLQTDPYLQYTNEPFAFLLHMDRIYNVALLLRQLDTVGHYVYGATLISGWDAVLSDLAGRLLPAAQDYLPQLQANEYMSLWRFGFVTHFYPVPPSAAGEFFMQTGMVGLAFLSLLFGFVLRSLRRFCLTGRSMFTRWLVLLLSLRLLTLSATQLSIIAPFIVLTLLPIVLVYVIARQAVAILDPADE
jgi:hypothetical protein